MKIITTAKFDKQSEKLPRFVQVKLKKQLQFLEVDMYHPSLNTKKMRGRANLWEARVDYHYRMIFTIQDDVLIVMAVGTHAVYR